MLTHRLSRTLFRLHIENGAAVAAAMAVVVAGAAVLFGRPVAALATTGALCASIVDQPGPFWTKARLLAYDVVAASSVTLCAALAGGAPWLLGPLIALTSAATAMTSAFGRRALGVGVTMVLALLFGMAAPPHSPRLEIGYAVVFACGGMGYAAVALVLTWATDDRTRKLFLSEAMLAFSRYVAVKAELFGPKPDFKTLVEAHAELVERIQAARDMLFTGRRGERRARWAAALIALMDAFDTVLAGDADIETLRASEHHHLMRRLQALLAHMAEDIHALAREFVTPAGRAALPSRAGELKAIADEIARVSRIEAPDITAFRATAHKLAQTARRLQHLNDALDPHTALPEVPPALDLLPFVAVTRTGWKVLRAQLSLASPVARYAIRLTLAMLAGYGLTLVFPAYVHGGWVMLTTALIMRANYSVTRRRRDDRVLGNLAGCLATMFLVRTLPPDALAAAVVIAIATSHAFGTVDYRVTAFAACISALLQLHFITPVAQPVLLERMLDTLIGAGLAWGFSHVLPSWEKRNIPRLLKALGEADRDYAAQALLRLAPEQAFRLARKRAHDASANLSMTVRRFADEPDLDRTALVAFQELLTANYLLASDLASMRVLFQRRAGELDPLASDELLAETSKRVRDAFADPGEAPKDTVSRHEGTSAAMALKRRLVHIERAARRVGALSAKARRYSS